MENNLPYSVVLFILALAFVDNDFKNKFQGPQDTCNLVVCPNKDRFHLR